MIRKILEAFFQHKLWFIDRDYQTGRLAAEVVLRRVHAPVAETMVAQ